jgi:hypothetical protein
LLQQRQQVGTPDAGDIHPWVLQRVQQRVVGRIEEVDPPDGLLVRPARLGQPVEGSDNGGDVIERGQMFQIEGNASNYTEILRLKGWVLSRRGDLEGAERNFFASLGWARRQQAKSCELRTSTSLAGLWQSQDKRQDAYELLAPVYGWFTEASTPRICMRRRPARRTGGVEARCPFTRALPG